MIQNTAFVVAVAADVDATVTGDWVRAETPVINGKGNNVWIISLSG